MLNVIRSHLGVTLQTFSLVHPVAIESSFILASLVVSGIFEHIIEFVAVLLLKTLIVEA